MNASRIAKNILTSALIAGALFVGTVSADPYAQVKADFITECRKVDKTPLEELLREGNEELQEKHWACLTHDYEAGDFPLDLVPIEIRIGSRTVLSNSEVGTFIRHERVMMTRVSAEARKLEELIEEMKVAEIEAAKEMAEAVIMIRKATTYSSHPEVLIAKNRIILDASKKALPYLEAELSSLRPASRRGFINRVAKFARDNPADGMTHRAWAKSLRNTISEGAWLKDK